MARVPIFAGLTHEQQLAVASFADPVHLEKDETLYGPMDRVSRLFVLHTGRVKIIRTSASGREHLVRVVEPGEAVGEHAFLTGSRPDHAVVASVPSQICTFAHQHLTGLVQRFPEISMAMLRSLSDWLAMSDRRVAMSKVDVTVRLAEYLLSLPGFFDAATGASTVALPMPKRDVAALLDTTPESLSRALAKLSGQGLIQAKASTVLLQDVDALEDMLAA